jgi:hypothetical protein
MAAIITTPIPQGTSRTAVLQAIQTHSLMIKALCPDLISYELVSGDANTQATYSVTDQKLIGKTTYKLTLTTREDGIDSYVEAKPPVGTLIIKGRWRVTQGEHPEISEEAEIEAPMIMKKMVKSNVEKTHPGQHKVILESVAA